MIIINSEDDFLKLWPYKGSKPSKNDMPKEYPCLGEVESHEGGIMGDQLVVKLIYMPKSFKGFYTRSRFEDFALGVQAVLGNKP